jgi:serine/threonine-protein kinase RsbW
VEVTVHLTIPGQQIAISRLRHWLREVLTDWAVSNECTWDLLLAITEICTNIIRHGYNQQPAGEITVQLVRRGTAIYTTISDTAPTFIPRHIMPPPPEMLAEGGYGLFLIGALMDEIIFEHDDGGVNRTILVKHDSFMPCFMKRQITPESGWQRDGISQ